MQSQRGAGEGLNNQGAAAAGKRDADGQSSAQEARRSTQKGTDDSLQMYQKKQLAANSNQNPDMASQPKQQPRVNGNTFKNYNGKKIISIQNSYQKAQILKNQHNNSSGGIQQQASKAVGGSSHSRKRSEKENQRAAPGNSAYSKIQLRTQDKHDESQEQAAAADQQQEGDAQANQSANGGGGTQGFHSIVCQVPQNQAASLQQM